MQPYKEALVMCFIFARIVGSLGPRLELGTDDVYEVIAEKD